MMQARKLALLLFLATCALSAVVADDSYDEADPEAVIGELDDAVEPEEDHESNVVDLEENPEALDLLEEARHCAVTANRASCERVDLETARCDKKKSKSCASWEQVHKVVKHIFRMKALKKRISHLAGLFRRLKGNDGDDKKVPRDSKGLERFGKVMGVSGKGKEATKLRAMKAALDKLGNPNAGGRSAGGRGRGRNGREKPEPVRGGKKKGSAGPSVPKERAAKSTGGKGVATPKERKRESKEPKQSKRDKEAEARRRQQEEDERAAEQEEHEKELKSAKDKNAKLSKRAQAAEKAKKDLHSRLGKTKKAHAAAVKKLLAQISSIKKAGLANAKAALKATKALNLKTTKQAGTIKRLRSQLSNMARIAAARNKTIRKMASEVKRLGNSNRSNSMKARVFAKRIAAATRKNIAQAKKIRSLQKEIKAVKLPHERLRKKYAVLLTAFRRLSAEHRKLLKTHKKLLAEEKNVLSANFRGPKNVDDYFAKLRKANKARFVAKYNQYNFYRVDVRGTINSASILAACDKLKLQTPCDHPSYYDGRCVVVMKRARHFSYSPHHSMDRRVMDGSYWYCGRANRGYPLQNWRNTHRWAPNHQNGKTYCVLPSAFTSRKIKWKSFRFWKVRVRGQMNSENIGDTCERFGLYAPCDHPSYQDGRCLLITKRNLHFSYSRHHNFPRRDIDRSYWYCGKANNGWALQNWRNTHRWSNGGDHDGTAFCVAPAVPEDPKKKLAVWHGWEWYKVRVNGAINSENIRDACKKYGYDVPCDHPSYADGRCAIIMKRNRHMSYSPHHSLDRNIVDRTYWYCGRANNERALQNWRNTHRWSTSSDKYGDTMCVKRVAPAFNSNKIAFTYHDWKFYKFRVTGQITSSSIKARCDKAKMLTPCDHISYSNGLCAAVMKRTKHFSYSPHHSFDRNLLDRSFWYCGRANHGRALQNWRGTHRWSRTGDMHGDIFCVQPPKPNPKKRVARWRGYDFYKVSVKGNMNSDNILRACKQYGYRVPCDHPSYRDGRCVVMPIGGRHMSYPPHNDFPRSIGDRVFWYCGRANHGKSLMTWRGTHRWSHTGDIYETTLCIK